MDLPAIQRQRLAIRTEPTQNLLRDLGKPIRALITDLRPEVLGFTTTPVIVGSEARIRVSSGVEMEEGVPGVLISCSKSEARFRRWGMVSRVRLGLRLGGRKL
jgi:hypothetical protein